MRSLHSGGPCSTASRVTTGFMLARCLVGKRKGHISLSFLKCKEALGGCYERFFDSGRIIELSFHYMLVITNKAFERYCQVQNDGAFEVVTSILKAKKKADVIPISKSKRGTE